MNISKKEIKTDEEKLGADIIIFTLRCSACNKSFQAIVTSLTIKRLDDRKAKNQIHECKCGAGYMFTHSGWKWKYNKKK